ncbi:hypothetical protein S1OALGB6SA_1136 [Olavius algarvensis spirochete endosymbiont]|uniref:ribosome hibernation-promoting factor, HPF/YfiA family n=1 Tax=Olavius algarvensis spirochete endosymbiont TaxID=260710 RepID=UPI000F189060|nr:ribosome-associated translation inhibitor RaiA [Olavius algarvensis spirochete endosymbiont]CAD7838280.1 MAG: hypothetical protein [Olavius algarvensis spirochete endosymbiont]VDB00063.1 hypothetical protein S1OALGB6SA_1136 [Olavius algarvensis spirochete endosymbiont]
MNLEIKGTHGYSPGGSTREYIDKKLKRLNHVESHMADLHLTLNREKNGEFRTEANFHFRWGAMGHIRVADRDLFKALDSLFDKIEVKATKEKDKIQEH